MFAWFARLAGRSERKHGAQAYPVIDAKTVIYAVGDIHGRADLLARVHEAIERDWRARPAERRLEIYLGDYVDRGPDSAAVIAMLRARATKSKLMPLSGNHEAVLLRFLDGRISDREWLDWGGAATALSYGVNPSKEAILSAALSRAVPLDDVRFLGRCGRASATARISSPMPASCPTGRWKSRCLTICCGYASPSSTMPDRSARSWCMDIRRMPSPNSSRTGSTSTPAPTPRIA